MTHVVLIVIIKPRRLLNKKFSHRTVNENLDEQ